MKYHKVVGIDLGTTYSAVSVWDYDRSQVVVIPSVQGSNTVPSVVGVDPEGKVIAGAPAQNNLVTDPANTVIEVKREMGVYERPPDPTRGDPGEPKRMTFRGRDYLPQEISAFILMELKRQAENFLGEPVYDAVITVPAYFKEPQKGATQDAAAMARLNCKQLLNEPTAAAVCFGFDQVKDGRKHTYAVYDLGGGTFDVSIIEVSEGNVSVVGTGGNSRLGGGDFDNLMTGWVLNQIKAKHGVDLSQDPMIWARIKREAEMRKRELSATTSALLNLPFLTPQLSVNIPITRVVFESLVEDLLCDSLTCLDEALKSAGKANSVERSEIDQVLLVGGSTRIPRVRKLVAEHMGLEEKDVRCDINPDEVVSRGAAIVAAKNHHPSDAFEGKEIIIDMAPGPGAAAPSQPALVLQDVTSHTLGILVNQSDFYPIIPKESRLPVQQTHGGFANGGRAKEIPVLIFQGEDPNAFNPKNTLIGKLPIDLPEPREEGYYKFEVTFALNTDGLLNVQVKCLNDNQIWKADLQCNVRATKEQIKASAQHLQEVMASGPAAGEPQAVAATVSDLPKPPSGHGLPRPPAQQHAAAPPPSAATPAPIASPPAETPEQFKSICRRSFKLLGQPLSPEKRAKLLSAYSAFVQAVQTKSGDVEELGDTLDDTYLECK